MEILKDSDMALDNTNNICLFSDKFKEKLLKDITTKQKLKLLFNSGFQHKLSNNTSGASYQPFRGSPLSPIR